MLLLPQISRSQQAGAISLQAPLPLDSSITIGHLSNGLTYSIRVNRKPEKRAELRLVVNAGSVLERNSQRGLAHFVEHMAFNGTKHFAKQDIVDYLESVGVRFGADLNAYTSFDETVYMLQVPTDSLSVLHKGFEILEDWAHLVSFDDAEIEKERGVVLEEWRLGRGAEARIRDKQFPLIFKNSRYADRIPIGLPDIIKSSPHDTLREFYREWYRPDLMAVVAVGDFDKHEIESLIKAHFAGIPPHANPPARIEFPVPDHKETVFAIATDPEASMTSFGVTYLQPRQSDSLAVDYRRSIIERLFGDMLNRRFEEQSRAADPPFVYAYAGEGAYVRTKRGFFLGGAVKEGGIPRGLGAVMTEAARVRRDGFTQTELDRVKNDALRGMESAYNEREKSESVGFADELIRNFLVGEPAPGIAYEFELYKRFVPDVTLDDVNVLARRWITPENRVVTISAPDKSASSISDTVALSAVINNVDRSDIKAYVDTVTYQPLMKVIPSPGSIVDRKVRKDIGVTELTLSNGVRVLLKPTDFKNDEVIFSASSKGGSSLVPDSDYIAAQTASAILQQGGIGEFDKTILEKLLSGKIANVSGGISELGQGIGGGCSPKDITTMFQLIHLTFTAPRADSTAFASFKSRTYAILQNRNARPEAAYDDTIQVTMARHHFRRRPFSIPMVSELNLMKSLRIYRDRFADASAFTFTFVGSFKVEDLEPLLTTYVASLPSLRRNEAWRDVGIRPPAGLIEKTVRRGIEQKSQVRLVFTGPFQWNRENRFALNALAEVLTIKLRESLREEKGGTYGVGVGANPIRIPEQQYQCTISFGCAPGRVPEMVQETFKQIDSLKRFPPAPSYIAKVKEMELREREVSMKQNGFWLGALSFCATNEIDPGQILTYADMVKSLTPDVVTVAARRYLNEQNYAKFVMLPEH